MFVDIFMYLCLFFLFKCIFAKHDTTTEQSVSVSSIPTIHRSEPGCGIRFAVPMEDGRRDESQCYFCASVHNCDLCTHTHYNLCARCRNSDPTQGWWGDYPQQINSTTNEFSDDGSFGDDDVFHTAGSAV
jgi:hypothetical protein